MLPAHFAGITSGRDTTRRIDAAPGCPTSRAGAPTKTNSSNSASSSPSDAVSVVRHRPRRYLGQGIRVRFAPDRLARWPPYPVRKMVSRSQEPRSPRVHASRTSISGTSNVTSSGRASGNKSKSLMARPRVGRAHLPPPLGSWHLDRGRQTRRQGPTFRRVPSSTPCPQGQSTLVPLHDSKSHPAEQRVPGSFIGRRS